MISFILFCTELVQIMRYGAGFSHGALEWVPPDTYAATCMVEIVLLISFNKINNKNFILHGQLRYFGQHIEDVLTFNYRK